jgi:hypothetical protein
LTKTTVERSFRYFQHRVCDLRISFHDHAPLDVLARWVGDRPLRFVVLFERPERGLGLRTLSAPTRPIDLRKLPGTYDRRYVRLILNADSSYRAEYGFSRCGVCPIHGTAFGRWRLANTALTLSPTQESGNTHWIPTGLEVLERGESEVMLVDPQSRRDFNRQGVTRGTCFLRTTREVVPAGQFRKIYCRFDRLNEAPESLLDSKALRQKVLGAARRVLRSVRIRVDAPAENAYRSPAFRQVDRFS